MLDRCFEIIEHARKQGSTLPLVKHLTHDRYERVKHRVTKHDHTLLDVIWPGIRYLQEQQEDADNDELDGSGGIIAPDFETYVVFQDLLKPMIKDLHGLGKKIQLHSDPAYYLTSDPKKGKLVELNVEDGGIHAPDSESYTVYKEVMDPIVRDLHGVDDWKKHPEVKMTRTQVLREELRLRRKEESDRQKDQEIHETIVPKKRDVNILILKHDQEDDEIRPELEIMDMDPTGKYVLSARIECSRNLDKFFLPKCLQNDEIEVVEKKLQNALKYQGVVGSQYITVNGGEIQGLGEGSEAANHYYTLYDILAGTNGIRTKMAANDLMLPLCDASGGVHSRMIHGSNWPDHRGVYLSLSGNLAAWVNVQDHLRIVCCSRIDAPGNIGEAYGRVAHLLTALDKHLPPKKDPTLGFLSSRPSCVGNTLRFQAIVRLPRLPTDIVKEFCDEANLLMLHTGLGDFTYKIKNRQSLGLTEYEVYENFTKTITNIVQIEREIEEENSKHVSTMLKNMFNKKFNSH